MDNKPADAGLLLFEGYFREQFLQEGNDARVEYGKIMPPDHSFHGRASVFIIYRFISMGIFIWTDQRQPVRSRFNIRRLRPVVHRFARFLPFMRFKKLDIKTALKLGMTGLVQFGLMYIFYLEAFNTLQAYEVALFTIFTPVFVTLIDDAFNRRVNILHLVVAFITIAGTWIIKGEALQSREILAGFLLVQASNLCYAFGQIYYRRVMAQHPDLKDYQVFGVLYLGGFLVTAGATLATVPLSTLTLTTQQGLTLFYLWGNRFRIEFLPVE